MNFKIVEHASSMPASVAPSVAPAARVAAPAAIVAAPSAPKVAAVPAVVAAAMVAAKPIAGPVKNSYEASCTKPSGQSNMKCVCDPAAKGYKLDGSVCKPDASVKACPIVNKKQLKLQADGRCA
jgi:hypothetical protein